MERIRIVLAELPRMLRDIVRDTIERQDDMIVVGDPASADAASAPGTAAPDTYDILITGLEDDCLSDRYAALMRRHPHLKVFGITGDARRAFLFELRPYRIALGDASPNGLITAIRGATTENNVGAR